ncbi:MAG: oxidoreductase, partial [Prochlorococcus sp.]
MLSHPFTRLLAVAIFPALIVYIVVIALSAAAGIQPGKVLTDLMQTCDLPVAVGMVSNFGFL